MICIASYLYRPMYCLLVFKRFMCCVRVCVTVCMRVRVCIWTIVV